MNLALRNAIEYINAKDLKFAVNVDKNSIEIGFGSKARGSIKMFVVFDTDTSVAIRSLEFVMFPVEKTAQMYELTSRMNRKFRWVKFYVEEGSNSISLAVDAVIQPENSGTIVWELLTRMGLIAEEAYPEYTRAAWT